MASIINFIQPYFKLLSIFDIDSVIEYLITYKFVALILCGTIAFVMVVDFIFKRRMNYDGAHIMITGGSSGIGLALAKEYVVKGAHVTLIARDVSKLRQAISSLEKIAPRNESRILSFLSLDLSNDCYEHIASTISSHIEQLSKSTGSNMAADVLINCAGTSIADTFVNLPASEFDRMLNVNVRGSILPTKAIVEGMIAKSKVSTNKAGRIVFVASQVAQVSLHGFTAYGASKWALRGLAESLQMELKPHNIMVSVAYPPDTDTPGYQLEMIDKPFITKALSESGTVFSSEDVAKTIVKYSTLGYFGVSVGLDGWLLKQLHPGMTPLNSSWEVIQQILFAPIARFISIFYLLSWDWLCHKETFHPTITQRQSSSVAHKESTNLKEKSVLTGSKTSQLSAASVPMTSIDENKTEALKSLIRPKTNLKSAAASPIIVETAKVASNSSSVKNRKKQA